MNKVQSIVPFPENSKVQKRLRNQKSPGYLLQSSSDTKQRIRLLYIFNDHPSQVFGNLFHLTQQRTHVNLPEQPYSLSYPRPPATTFPLSSDKIHPLKQKKEL